MASADGAETEILQSRLAQLHDRGSLELRGAVLDSSPFLPEFYKLWRRPPLAKQVIKAEYFGTKWLCRLPPVVVYGLAGHVS